jgi:choline dehydrogenase-like flavoprotein
LREGRCRQFGGTANLWNHEVRDESARHIRYVPLDEIDFERRDWVPESGWPFSRREIQPFYERAQQVCGIGNSIFELGFGESGRKTASPGKRKKSSRSSPNSAPQGFFWSIIAENSSVMSV